VNIGVFGGTFDPPHTGHIVVAEQVRQQMNLEKIILVPCAIPPHKREREISPGVHRLEMLRLAVKNHPGLDISTYELDRGGVSYTVDTLTELRRMMPDASFFLLVGMDNIADFATWKDPDRILMLAHLIVMTRPGFPAESRMFDEESNISVCAVPAVDVSSSEIRGRVSRGEAIHGLVPESVEQYIHHHRLYRND
jgi:nicotinate-nucleotide adenylyltransferase